MRLAIIALAIVINCICISALKIGERDAEWKDSFQLCPVCGKPLVKKFNIDILQFRLRFLLLAGIPIVLVGSYAAFSMLPWLGFGVGGVYAKSFAAAWQASMNGTVASGSLFAIFQALGTSFMYKMIFGATTGATLTYLLVKIKENAQHLYFCECK